MPTSDSHKRFTRRPSALLASAGVVAAMLIAGCGGASYSSPAASHPASATNSHTAAAAGEGSGNQPQSPASEAQPPTASAETGAIPQNNGGDQDADNNGGPSDGDGNV
jgi:hypothetical protein